MQNNEDGLISGLREDQLVTAEEVDSAVREARALTPGRRCTAFSLALQN